VSTTTTVLLSRKTDPEFHNNRGWERGGWSYAIVGGVRGANGAFCFVGAHCWGGVLKEGVDGCKMKEQLERWSLLLLMEVASLMEQGGEDFVAHDAHLL